MPNCANCDQPLTGPFCAACGQKADTRRISWAWLAHELQHSMFHVDKGLWLTLRELFTRPGHAIREFLEGHRVHRFKPFATLIVVATVYSLLYRFMQPDVSELMPKKDMAEVAQVAEVANKLMGQYYALFELSTLGFIALASWLWMRKYGHNFVEHLVIQAYVAGQRIVLGLFFLPLNLLGMKAALAGSSILTMLYGVGYLLTMLQLYQDRRKDGVVLRTVATIATFLFMLLLITLALTIVFAVNKSKG